jgi:UDP-hydrolysing UDP-N-acetyl-D-glucosamine 2-epimerase
MSHFHLVVLDDYKRRLLQMGEEKWRIKTIGLHELNFKKRIKPFSKKFLTNKFKFDFSKPYCLLTFHPVTLELDKLKFQLINLVKALKKININIVITYPNADPQHEKIIYLFKKYCSSKKNYLIVKNLGTKNFVSVIRNCQFMIGNSSSGIVEAGTFKKPAINIGSRQKGKFKPVNVIDTNYSTSSILKSIKKANTLKFKNKIKNMKNPYESRVSVKKVSDLIIKLKANDKLLRKKFVDL